MSDVGGNRTAALDASRAIAAGELAARADDQLAPGFFYDGPAGMKLDRAAYIGYMSGLKAAFPDMVMSFDHVVAEGDKVACRWTNTMTQTGEFNGIPATGRQIAATGAWVREVQDGKVVAEWDNTDATGLLQQLGVVPAQ